MVTFVREEKVILVNWAKEYKSDISPEQQKNQVMLDFSKYVIEHRTEVKPEEYVQEMSKYIYFDSEKEFIESMNLINESLNNESNEFSLEVY